MGQKGIQSCSPSVFTTVWYNTSVQGSKFYLTLIRPGLMLNHQLLKETELKKRSKEQNLIKNSSFGWFLALAPLNLEGWALKH